MSEPKNVLPENPVPKKPTLRGRGTTDNPQNRFEKIKVHFDPTDDHLEYETEFPKPSTQFFHDHARSIISYNDSPDIGMSASLNAYRGCEHGCSYCYARQTHEYLGFGSGIDFETKIMVKLDAPNLLRKELSKKSWQPQPLMMSGVTDIYQPAERKFKLTRALLQVLLDFRNPAGLITKNALVLRDLDILKEMASLNLVRVALSITSLDNNLQRILEPRTSVPAMRFRAVEQLAKAGVPVGVMTAPIIPGLNDHEIPALVQAASDAGANWVGYTMLHLPYSVKEVFQDWVERHFPDSANKILGRIRDMRGGKLNDPRFGSRMRGEGEYAEQVRQLHRLACRKAGFAKAHHKLSIEHFRIPRDQEFLFE